MKLLVFDRTCLTTRGGLTAPWWVGAHLYRGLGRIDAARGVASWQEALEWIATHEQISELQYWGHGRWGRVYVGEDPLAIDALSAGHSLHAGLVALRERLTPDALVWLRTCEAFGADRGIAFAEALSAFFGVRVAGHTHVIGFHQSGLHGLLPGARADWSPDEGIAEGTAAVPLAAKGSRPWATRTITCLRSSVPDAWFAGA